MKRTLAVILGAASVLLLAATTVSAAPSPKATGGAEYTTVASGQMFDTHVSFTAQGTPDDAKGQVQAQNQGVGGADWHGRVDCYDQDGNMAWFSGVITHFRPGAENSGATGFFQVSVVDGGEPGVIAMDMISARRADDAFDCADRQPAMRMLEGGNIQVHQ